MEISLSSNSITGGHIATKLGTCHDSTAVVPCAKFCSDHFISFWMRAKWNFHHIWIVMEKLLVKWAPGLGCSCWRLWSTMLQCVFVESQRFLLMEQSCSMDTVIWKIHLNRIFIDVLSALHQYSFQAYLLRQQYCTFIGKDFIPILMHTFHYNDIIDYDEANTYNHSHKLSFNVFMQPVSLIRNMRLT